MKLYDVLPEAKKHGIGDAEITGITDNTATLEKGNIFVAIKGKNFDGHSVCKEMLDKGASIVITEHDTGVKPQFVVKNTREFLNILASRYYGNPTKKLKLIGVTGTNGKSTIVNVVSFMLNKMNHKCGSIGTVGYDVCGKVYEAHLTTPYAMDLYRYFAEMVENGAEYCVMETSSQSLAQSRIANESFEIGVFTNLTQDHLDYHGTMEKYFKAKKLLFSMCKKAVVCIDDKYGEKLVKSLKIPVKTYSIKDTADYYSVNIKTRNGGVSYWLSSMELEKSYPVDFKMPGRFNVANSMAAFAVCRELGMDENEAVKVMQECKGVRGRSEVLYDGDFTVICDYAHTEDALLKILTSVRSFANGRVICLFGAAGERDADKRRPMGSTAAQIADYLILTSDNPRFEDPQSIIDQVKAGIEDVGTPYKEFVDRLEAIKYAMLIVGKGDILLLCGKGHETYQVIGDDYQEFDEHKIINDILKGNMNSDLD